VFANARPAARLAPVSPSFVLPKVLRGAQNATRFGAVVLAVSAVVFASCVVFEVLFPLAIGDTVDSRWRRWVLAHWSTAPQMPLWRCLPPCPRTSSPLALPLAAGDAAFSFVFSNSALSLASSSAFSSSSLITSSSILNVKFALSNCYCEVKWTLCKQKLGFKLLFFFG
jgi:hypothetical protein